MSKIREIKNLIKNYRLESGVRNKMRHWENIEGKFSSDVFVKVIIIITLSYKKIKSFLVANHTNVD